MIDNDILFTEGDLKAAALLDEFLPDKIFDMHNHIGTPDFCPNMFQPDSIFYRCGPALTMDTYLRDQGPFFGKSRTIRANLITCPDQVMADLSNGSRDASTKYLAEELDKHPECVGEIVVLAADTVESIEAQLIHPRIRGFKCYHFTANKEVTWQCGIGEYLPEAAWQVADKHGFCITLHMVRDQALADEGNMAYICEMAAKYPNAKLVLAHAGRSFASWTAIETVAKLAPYPNVLFDFSAVCEATAFFEIIRKCGHKRVMWGSDYPVSMMRGKCISIGATFLWLYKEQLDSCTSKTAFSAYLIGMENLLAMRTACNMLDLDRQAVEDIFYNNAMELFGLED